MARISVVVPIYDVEEYLPACLRSLAGQTLRDLEVVMVDDGSTDGSAAIAEHFAARDRRFRLIAQANVGLGHARNTGADAATGELLAFVDSDDVVPGDAYELLAGSLDRTGSDFASGNVLRLTGERTSQAPFLAGTFARTRLRTHVTRFRPLLADRIACNKLWRRAFWDDNALRFPEGVLHEDIPVTLPAHVMAESVDVLAEPVYQWRVRGDGERSITQRRLEMRALVDRLAAVEHVRAYLAEHGSRRLRRWYDERLVRDELRLYLDLLAEADDDYRAVFVQRAGALFEDARSSLFARLPAIDRLKWHLLLRERTDELVEVLRFQQERKADTPPLRRLGRWYGDYPFRGDRELAVPGSVYRLGKPDAELALHATIEELRGEDGALVVRGHAHLGGLAVRSAGDQRVQLLAVRPGRWQRVRLRATAARASARPLERPDLAGEALDRRWSGFEAALSPAALRAAGRRRRPATWHLCLYVRAHGLRRRFVRFVLEDLASAELPAGPGLVARAVPCPSGRIEVQVRDRWVVACGARLLHGDVLELNGALHLPSSEPATQVEVRRAGDGWSTEFPMIAGESGSFTAGIPLSELYVAPPDAEAAEELWQLSAIDGGRRVPLALRGPSPALRWWSSGRELTLARTPAGEASIAVRDARPLIAAAVWTGADRLELDVRLPPGLAERELVLMDWHRNRAHAVALVPGDEEGVYRAIVAAAELLAVPAGLTPRRGEWRLYGRPLASSELPAMARVQLADALRDTLPLTSTLADRAFTLEPAPDGSLMLTAPARTAAPARARGARESARGGARGRAAAG